MGDPRGNGKDDSSLPSNEADNHDEVKEMVRLFNQRKESKKNIHRAGSVGAGAGAGAGAGRKTQHLSMDNFELQKRSSGILRISSGNDSHYFRSTLGDRFKEMKYRFFSKPTQRSNSSSSSNGHDDHKMKFRRKLKRYMATSNFGLGIDFFNIALSLLSCVMYVWETYDSDKKTLFESIDVAFSLFFAFDYFLRLYMSDSRLKFFFSPMAVLDLITIVPVLFSMRESVTSLHDAAQVVRVLRILRIVRINRFILSTIDSEINRQATLLVTTIITAAFFCAGLVQIFESPFRLENRQPKLEFHECLYFVIVTISTVGYGDISPGSDLSRLAVALLICAALIYIPKATNHLITLMSSKSIYARRIFRPPPQTQFVLVCGSLDVVSTQAFLTELFHEDHGRVDLHAVLLNESIPSAGMENLLSQPEYQVGVTYLQGSPLEANDLMRCSLLNASACFILCNKFTNDPEAEDAATILRALSIKRFYMQIRGEDLFTCFQIMREENKHHFTLSHEIMLKDLQTSLPLINNDEDQPSYNLAVQTQGNTKRFRNAVGSVAVSPMELPKRQSIGRISATYILENEQKRLVEARARLDPIICVNEIKMNLLAQACLCPGIITMIGNLVMSVDAPARDLLDIDSQNPGSAREKLWQQEYHYGSEFEIYRTKLSPVFQHIPFAKASALVHGQKGVLMFALELSVGNYSRVIMNPGNFPIPKIDSYNVHCFVIATDLDTADLSHLVEEPSKGVSAYGVQSMYYSNMGGTRTEMKKESLYNILAELQQEERENEIALSSNSMPKKKREGDQKVGQAKGRWGIVKNNITPGFPQTDSDTSLVENEDDDEEASSFEQTNFYMMDEPRPLRDVMVERSLEVDFPEITNHIVICGSLSGMVSLVRTLRARHLEDMSPIVLLNYEIPSPSLWMQLARFPLIYFVQGSSTERSDLKRAGLKYATKAIVLARPMGNGIESNDSTMGDAHAIFAHQGAIGMNPEIQIVTELINLSNVGFLDIGGEKAGVGGKDIEDATKRIHKVKLNYTDALQFIAGVVFSSSMLDTLISQSYYNPHITTVFEQLISGGKPPMKVKKSTFMRNGRFIDNDAERRYNRIQFIKTVKESHLFQIYVPKEFVRETYGSLFKELVDKWGMVPLGLLRAVQNQLSSAYRGNKTPYVFTNPPSSTILAKGDKVFLLSGEAPNPKLAGKSVADIISQVTRRSRQTKLGLATRGQPDMVSLSEEISDLKKSMSEMKMLLRVLLAKSENDDGTFDSARVSSDDNEEVFTNLATIKKSSSHQSNIDDLVEILREV